LRCVSTTNSTSRRFEREQRCLFGAEPLFVIDAWGFDAATFALINASPTTMMVSVALAVRCGIFRFFASRSWWSAEKRPLFYCCYMLGALAA